MTEFLLRRDNPCNILSQMAKKQVTLTAGMWRRVRGMVFEHVDSEKQVEIHDLVDSICVSGPQFVCSGSTGAKAKAKPAKATKPKSNK